MRGEFYSPPIYMNTDNWYDSFLLDKINLSIVINDYNYLFLDKYNPLPNTIFSHQNLI